MSEENKKIHNDIRSMPQKAKTLIMKFGGASVKTPESFSHIAELIIKKSETYPHIAIVVSAMGGMTDQLIGMATKVNSCPPRREYDMLVSTGERISISLLAMAISAKGREAVSFTGSQSGIITSSQHAEARIIDMRPYRLHPYLEAQQFVIVAGFQGVSREKEITTLGRGGSDTTAVALGIALRAEKVEFYKDVAGIFQKDPKITLNPPLYAFLSYQEALEVVNHSGGKVLHPRAIQLAQKNQLLLHVRSFLDMEGEGTFIGNENLIPMEPSYEDDHPTC
jgi:aspartate kinase